VDLQEFISRIEFTITAEARRIRLRSERAWDGTTAMVMHFFMCI
jgi:hypothetical protein